MSTISSRTPDGLPGRCPVCRADVVIAPSGPLDDASCPNCGTLIWPLPLPTGERFIDAAAIDPQVRRRLRSILESRPDDEAADSLDRFELVMDLEEALGIDVPDDLRDDASDIGELIQWLFDRLDERGDAT